MQVDSVSGRESLSTAPKEEKEADGDISGEQEPEHFVAAVDAHGAFGEGFAMGEDAFAIEIAAEVGLKCGDSGVACGGILSRGLIGDGEQGARRVGGEERAQENPERVDVGARGDFGFGGGPSGSAADFANRPVHDEDFAEGADHNVRGLEVAMDDALGVRVTDGVGDLLEQAQAARERFGGVGGIERFAFDEAHGVVGAAIGERAGFKDGRDAGVFEAGDVAGFGEDLRGLIAARVKDLEGDVAGEAAVVDGIDGAHAAAAEFFFEREVGAGEIGEFGDAAEVIENGVGERHGIIRRGVGERRRGIPFRKH